MYAVLPAKRSETEALTALQIEFHPKIRLPGFCGQTRHMRIDAGWIAGQQASRNEFTALISHRNMEHFPRSAKIGDRQRDPGAVSQSTSAGEMPSSLKAGGWNRPDRVR